MKQFFLAVFLTLATLFGLPGMALANTCAPAATQGSAPSDYKDYCWLEFSGYNDATALSAGGQTFSFTLPDLSTLSMKLNTVKVAGTGSPAIITKAVPSWSGAAFGNTAFVGIPGQTILYSGVSGSTVRVTLSNITVSPPPGGTGIAKYAIIVGDGESSNANETLSFTTNADPWVQLARIQNGSSSLYPALSGVGTATVTETGVTGTVGSYVFGSFNNPTQISAQFKGSGLQGFIVGVRYASISVVSAIAGQRFNASDQFTYAIKSAGGTSLASGASSGAALTFTPVSLPTVAASYPFVLEQAMAAGSTGTLANYTVSLSCTNAATGTSTTVLPTNAATSSYTIAGLQYGDAVNCTFTNTPIFSAVAGTVYNDANHNASQDGAETGAGVSGWHVKLAPSSGGVCQTPASKSAAVNSATGAYSLTQITPGAYCLILDDNATLSDITPALPAGRLGTQNASGVIQLTVASTPAPNPQNFGLYHGSRLSGTVFADTGVGAGGVANTGIKDGTEPGLGDVSVSARAGGTVVTTASTAGDGSYTLWLPETVNGTVTITPTAPSGYLATGGSAGTTSTASGTYSRPSVTYTASAIAGKSYTGVNFGLVPANALAPNGAQTAQPGTVVFYAHTFTPGSGGQVTFSLSSAGTPGSLVWTQVLYRDASCSGTLDASAVQVTAAITVTAGQALCLIVKQFVPAAAALGAQNTTTLTALFSYTGSNPLLSGTLSVIDVTIVGEPSALALNKRVSNITQSGPIGLTTTAQPGDTLEYTLTALNNGSEALSALVINDATPAFTTFLSALCPATLPGSLTACSLSVLPPVGTSGNLQWTFSGQLAPSGQLAVTYRVKINQ